MLLAVLGFYVQWFITLGNQLDSLDSQQHTVFGQVSEGFDILGQINEAYCDKEGRPYRDIRSVVDRFDFYG